MTMFVCGKQLAPVSCLQRKGPFERKQISSTQPILIHVFFNGDLLNLQKRNYFA